MHGQGPTDNIMADNPQGRPTKLTPEVHKAIVEAIRAGASRQAAAASVGIAGRTLLEWIARGDGTSTRESSEDFARLAQDLHAAEADFEQTLIKDVLAYSAMGEKPDWRGPAWLLERRFSDRWGKTTKTELTGRDGGPVQVSSNTDFTKLSDAELRAISGRPDPGKQGEGPGGTGTPTP